MYETMIITGATSFIGISLIKELLERRYQVVAIIRPNSKRKHLIEQYADVIIIEQELGQLCTKDIQAICEGSMFLFHLGWASDFINPRNNIAGQFQNVNYTLDAISLATQCGCEAFIGVGSQAECGVLDQKITEMTMDNPNTAYAYAKCETYKQSKMKCEENGLRFCWPRILSAYGPYDRPHTLVMSCIDACIENRKIEFTDCKQIWDYVYVTDVAKALIAIAFNGKHAVKYPIASGIGYPLSEYINIISKVMDSPCLNKGIGKIPHKSDQPMYLVGNIDKLTNDTGFVPFVEFEDGVKRILDNINKKGIY